jgi:hypothetical protein
MKISLVSLSTRANARVPAVNMTIRVQFADLLCMDGHHVEIVSCVSITQCEYAITLIKIVIGTIGVSSATIYQQAPPMIPQH